MIEKSSIWYNKMAVKLEGHGLRKKETLVKDLNGYFLDTVSYQQLDPNTVMYRVEFQDNNLIEGTHGGLYFGITYLYPGIVGKEYFLTKGHFHKKRDTGEYYFGLTGQGLLMMTKDGETYIEKVVSGSVHYIPGNTAHRLINTGAEILAVSACWQSESGHDYSPPEEMFSKRILQGVSGKITIKKKN